MTSLIKSEMTPQEVFEYKLSWKPNSVQLRVCSDLDAQCKTWCRTHIERWEWSFDAYTAPYEHTFHFEHEEHAEQFSKHFEQWIR